MRSFALASALAAATLVQAGPTPTEPELPRRANSVPTVTVSGNGKPDYLLDPHKRSCG
jgi:1,3-beta-glucanosyltransferase GAS5